MTEWLVAASCAPEPHVPPPEYSSPALRRWNKAYQTDRVATPTNEYGLVDTEQLLSRVASHIRADYTWPEFTNVHHLYYPRAEYDTDSMTLAFRELTANKVSVPIQAHNVLHALVTPVQMPGADVMRQALLEDYLQSTAFAQGRCAVQLIRLQQQVESGAYVREHVLIGGKELTPNEYATQASIATEQFYEYLERYTAAYSIGLGADPNRYANTPLAKIVEGLGRVAGRYYLDYRFTSQQLVRTHGFTGEKQSLAA